MCLGKVENGESVGNIGVGSTSSELKFIKYPDKINKGDVVSEIIFESENLVLAYNLASERHVDQKRVSGEPYFNHCVEVTKIIHNEFGIRNENYLIAALLHDTVEDTGLTLDQVKKMFGDEVAELIGGVTKLEKGTDKETLNKVLDKTYLNPGVAVIKLADRLHNMRTLGCMEKKKRENKAQETMDVYTKLAESLGMWEVKTELEDLCFLYLDEEGYSETKKQIDNDPRLDPLFLANIKSKIEIMLEENNYVGEVETRKNGYWSLKKKQGKLAMQGKCSSDNFTEINDVVSLRVRLTNVGDCYRFVELLHEELGEMVDYDRYDEFIGANKRVNGYQAIQTTLNTPQGPVEVAMVTDEMEDFNNWGVVNLIKNNETDLKDYVLKFVFTPTGSLRFMSQEATGVDFAALVNQRVLADAIDIKIDGEREEISVKIPNASTVEVNVGESKRAPIIGLEEYGLPETRKIIGGLRRLENRDTFIEKGKKIMENILAPRGLLDLSYLGGLVNPIIYHFGCEGCDDLHFMVGVKAIKINELENELDRAHLTKKELDLTTIRLIGRDHPGILIDVVKKISDLDLNIVHVIQNSSEGVFNLQLIVKGLNPEQEESFRQNFSRDSRFSSNTVV